MKKTLFLLAALLLLPASAFAQDFSGMSPTVKIISYKHLHNGHVLAFGTGSGTVVTSSGRIVTNNHVIFDENENTPMDAFGVCITFNLSDEPDCEYTARLVANNKDLDLAILQMNDTDVYGNPVGNLQYLDYNTSANPKEQDRVQVYGYPGSGGDSITLTQGQISGVELFNDAKYYKTDSDIDFGNSGGTVLDANGNYIGIPTFIRSLAETLGYFIDIRDARPWIEENIGNAVPTEVKGEELVELELGRIAKANDELKYRSDEYPQYKIELPSGWKFDEITTDGFYVHQKKLSNRVGLSTYVQYYPFKVDDGYMDELYEQLTRLRERYPDYKQNEDATFAGADAIEVTYTAYNAKNYNYYIPYGYALIGVSYSIDLDEKEKQEAAIAPVLESFELIDHPVNNPMLPNTIEFEDPDFSLTMSGNFRIQKNPSSTPIQLLAEAAQRGNYKGSFQIYYRQTPKDDRGLSSEDRLNQTVKNIGGSTKLVYKNDEVVLDGLEGYLYTIEYEGSKYQEIYKRLTLKVVDGDYEFTFQYDDLTENFDRNLPHLRAILNSFEFGDDSLEKAGEHDFGTLGLTFSDIQYHRFANAIGSLAEKDIVSGYEDGTFRPEASVARAEALKMILASKNHIETKKSLGAEVNFDPYAPRKSNFYDVTRADWFNKYVNYAVEEEIVSGKSATRFAPRDSVTLAEALKIAYAVYDIPLWVGDTSPWTKKYMDKAYELGLLPRGWDNPNMRLTRAELSFLVNVLYEQAK